MKLKCVAMLGHLFLKTDEVSLEITGCRQPRLDHGALQRRHSKLQDLGTVTVVAGNLVTNTMPFDFIKSNSANSLTSFLLVPISILINAR